MTNRDVGLEKAIAVARKLGLVWRDAAVLAEGTNIIVHFRPTPVVARVTQVAHLVRGPEALSGAVSLARNLPTLAIQPSEVIDPGPHVEGGRYVTFWTYMDGAAASPSEAGLALHAFHEQAARYTGQLRSSDPRPEALRVAELVGGEPAAALRFAAEHLPHPQLPQWPIHGDAHLDNALVGAVWQDPDDFCRGPREWDLACLRHRWYFRGEIERETIAALTAYGPYDRSALAALEPLVVLFTAAWGSLAPLIGEPIGRRTQQRLEWLRAKGWERATSGKKQSR